MRIKILFDSVRKIYQRTTVIEGTIHLIKGVWKMNKVFFISAYWKHNFSKCGKNLSIFPKVKIQYPRNVKVGDNVTINYNSYIRNENPEAKVKIDNNVEIGMNVEIDCSGGIDIGEKTVISGGVSIHTHSHGFNPWDNPVYKKLKIGKNVWIGEKAIILPNVSEINEGAVIGAGSIVTKNVPNNTVVAGNPAKIIREIK